MQYGTGLQGDKKNKCVKSSDIPKDKSTVQQSARNKFHFDLIGRLYDLSRLCVFDQVA